MKKDSDGSAVTQSREARPDARQSASACPRELDSRVSDGIHVRMLWHATDVFLHPYAYAGAHPSTSGPAADVAGGVGAAL